MRARTVSVSGICRIRSMPSASRFPQRLSRRESGGLCRRVPEIRQVSGSSLSCTSACATWPEAQQNQGIG